MPLDEYVRRSRATADFRDSVDAFLRSGRPQPRLRFDSYCPPVKVERFLTRLLELRPELPIESVALEATSGCEFFRGTADVEAGAEPLHLEFEWNCRWKAEQLGWTDWFGLPDQARAARECGHDCFRVWRERRVGAASAA